MDIWRRHILLNLGIVFKLQEATIYYPRFKNQIYFFFQFVSQGCLDLPLETNELKKKKDALLQVPARTNNNTVYNHVVPSFKRVDNPFR